MLFVRSNLNSHFAQLDRYQSGEVLSCGRLSSPLNTQLLIKANRSFTSSEIKKSCWQLKNQYVVLMKRLYLLNDFVLQRRYQQYQAIYWLTANADNALSVKIENAKLFFQYGLKVVFAPLVKDIEKQQFNGELNGQFRKQICRFWTKATDAMAVIDNFNPLLKDILALQVDEFEAFVRIELVAIAGEFNHLKLRKVNDNSKRIMLGSYRSGMLSLLQKL